MVAPRRRIKLSWAQVKAIAFALKTVAAMLIAARTIAVMRQTLAPVGRHKPSFVVRHASNSNCIQALMLRAIGIAAMPIAPNNEIANTMLMPTPTSVNVIGVRIILRP